MIPAESDRQLRRRALWLRVGFIGAIACLAFVLRDVDPEKTRLPFATSCGALTGLPCIFCGTTRALHHLLNGHFARALYFNWLAFPVALLVLAFCARSAAEIFFRRAISLHLPKVNLNARNLAAIAACIFALWCFQVSLAIGLHKQELVNPRGVLYRALVR